MKPSPLVVAATLVLAALPPAYAQGADSGDWLLRARALHLDSADKDNTGLDLSLDNRTFAEVDITYFFTPSWAAELVLTYPQKHTLYAGGSRIGTVKHLPPTLLAQYHFSGMAGWRPYVGVGINVTRFSDASWEPAVQAALSPDIDRTSIGAALQIGLDVPVGGGWLLNFDLKKVQIETDVSANGARVGTFKIDPLLFSVGAGYRF